MTCQCRPDDTDPNRTALRRADLAAQARFSMAGLLALARFLATTGDIAALDRVTAEIHERWSSETALDN